MKGAFLSSVGLIGDTIEILIMLKMCQSFSYTRCPKKMYLTSTFYFEAVSTTMSGIIGFLVSPNLYNSFDSLLICFHELMSKWQ